MTPRDIGFFVAVVCISVLIGTLLGIVCRGRPKSSIICGIVVSILLFVILEWRFGGPDEWSPSEPFASAAYMIGPFVILVCAPMILVALFVGRWRMRRKVI
jgi:uncharacterized membrane protein YkgB